MKRWIIGLLALAAVLALAACGRDRAAAAATNDDEYIYST